MMIHVHTLFFFNDPATTEIYTLSLHDALPISHARSTRSADRPSRARGPGRRARAAAGGCRPTDRKSTRLNSSHSSISYAVFCLKKKKKHVHGDTRQDYAAEPVQPLLLLLLVVL